MLKRTDAKKRRAKSRRTKSAKANSAKAAPSTRRLLYSRPHTAAALDCSISTVIRLENSGALDKIRLRGESGLVYHRAEQVEALAAGKE